MPFVLKFLAPEVLASVVIGKGGAAIAEMRSSTGAKIALTAHNELYPGTDCRVITAQATSEESLLDVARQIAGKVAEVVQGGAAADSIGGPGLNELKFRPLMPRAAVGGLIGKGGAAIRQLRASSSAKITIGDAVGSGPGEEQVVTIIGTQEAIEYCMGEVNRQVQALSSEPWFPDWAGSPGVVLATGGSRKGEEPPWSAGGGGGKSSRDAGKGYGGDRPGPPADMGRRHGRPQSGLDLMIQIARSIPEYVMEDERGFALTCTVPSRLVGGLIGRAGSGTKEVQSMTHATVSIREVPGDPESQSLNITGPLSNTCAAYMLMMKRYLDAESNAANPPPPRDEGRRGGGKPWERQDDGRRR